MRLLPASIFACLITFLFGSGYVYASINPQSGSASVNAKVTNPSQTPTITPTPTGFTVLSSTPTPKAISPSVSPSAGPTSAPGQTVYLDISGFASPNASIVMTSDNVFIRATVADNAGNFYISQIGVKVGFSSFCLENVDFQRIGDSLTCFEIPPVTSSTSKKDIFLPPSLGLSSRKTTPLSYIYAFGYTMPGSKVDLKVSDAVNLKATASKNGYYNVKVDNLAVGTYELFATANYNGKNSVKPSKTQELKSLSPAEIARENLITTIWRLLTRFGWIAVPVLILIFILISKRLRDWLITVIKGAKAKVIPPPKEPKHLHHYWFIGY